MLTVKDMGLLVARGVGGPQGLWLSSVGELGPLARVLSNVADTAALVSAVLSAANDAVLVPVLPGANVEVRTAWWYNGGVVSGNIDVGLYDADFKRLTSTGAVAQNGATVVQSAALVVPVPLLAGRPYYLALSASSATAEFEALDSGSIQNARALGPVRGAAAHPLPAVLTPAVMAQKQIPVFGLTQRTAAV